MILPELKKIDSENPELNKFQGYVKDQFSLINGEFLRGRYITEVVDNQETDIITILTTDKTFEHRLGRNLVGYFIVDQRANAVIWRSNTLEPQTNLTLRASANVQAKIWVF